jgi:hypothetical protein
VTDQSVPFDGIVLQQAAALGSVGAGRLPELLGRVDQHLADRLPSLRRRFEQVSSDDEREVFLVSEEFWPALGEELGLAEREWKAVRRAHEAQLLRLGSELDRREEFETALDIRGAVVVSQD